MRVVAYIRVSSADQALEGFSLPDQRREIERYCAGRGWDEPTIYEEPGDSAYTDEVADRPVFARLMAEVAQRRWDAIVVKKLDRFARSAIVSFTQLRHVLDHGCTLVDLAMQIDYATTAGRMVFGFLAMIAENESRMISDRTRAGIAEKRRQGGHVGGIPWGATRTPEARLAIVPELAPTLARVLELAAAHSFGVVAATLNREGRPSPRGAIWQPAVIHKLVKGGRWLLDQPEPWPALWAAAHARPRAPAVNWHRNTAMLTGLARCACGGYIVMNGIRTTGRGIRYRGLQCRRYAADRPTGHGCPHRKKGPEHYEALFARWLLGLPDLRRVRPVAPPDALALLADIAERRETAGLLLDGRSIARDEYKRRIAALDAEELALRLPAPDFRALAEEVRATQALWPLATPAEQNAYARHLVSGVLIAGPRMTIVPIPALRDLLDAHGGVACAL